MHVKNVKESKNYLRKKYKKIRKNMSLKQKQLMDDRILRKLIILDKYIKSKTIFIYVSKDTEVSTYEIMKAAWKMKKRVAVPKCDTLNKSMDFYYINSIDELERGHFGLYEPIEAKSNIVDDLTEGLCVVPGVSFDGSGYRLGYGHGYYDRFLPRFKGYIVGICYSNCISFKLPRGVYDQPVDILLTDRGIKRIYKTKRQD